MDLKIVNFYLGNKEDIQSIHVFYAYGISQRKDKYWEQKLWPIRKCLTVGEKNIIHQPLVEHEKIIFPPLHIKLGLTKQFVKALNVEGDCSQCICTTFPGLSYDK